MVQIRETVPEIDVERICEISNQFDPGPITPASYLPKMQVVPEGWSALRLSGLVDGELAGYAYVRRSAGMHPGVYLLTLAVDQKMQGRGHGEAILRAVLDRAGALGVRRLVPMVRETHATAEQFFVSRGFERMMSLRESTLSLDGWGLVPFGLPAGYRLVRWSEVEDSEENRAEFARVVLAMDLDEPGTVLLGGSDRVSVERDAFDPETCEPRYLYLVEFDGKWVAHHQVRQLKPGSWETADITFTGTLPCHRGRGLATALKNLGAAEMRALGAKRIMTHNDSSNAAMLAINKRQGFVEEPGWVMMVKDL